MYTGGNAFLFALALTPWTKLVFSPLPYLSVFIEWSALLLDGLTQAIMMIFTAWLVLMNESHRTIVSLDAQNGT